MSGILGKVAASVISKIIGIAVLLFLVSSIGAVLVYKVVPVYATPLMVIRCFQQLGKGEHMKWKHHWVPLENMSVYMPVAVMASEDQRFLQHRGFDLDAIQDAAIERIKGERRRGGSTISQQTAKNVFLWPTSSWVRKGFEAYFTVLIEFIWGKKRIMEVYLNSIEMGNGIYGAEAVAETHFNETAGELTRAQCALVAATLPNPLRFNSASPSAYVRQRQREIMQQMKTVDLFPME